ncbi:tRNA (adenosine(37)-N6)-threonylcarbamoyltransferase complex dimerization subunit type 1 TsaB [Dolosicoccus paucivorans]
MKQVIVDTSTTALSIALIEDKAIQLATTIQGPKKHGEALVDVVHQSLSQVNWTPQLIDELIVGVGPGSYTGLRIGVTFAKAWSVMKKMPLKSVSSLSLIAANGISLHQDHTLIIPIMDARRQTAYIGAYTYEAGQLKSVISDCHTAWDHWLEALKTNIELLKLERLILVGEKIDEFIQLTQEAFPHLTMDVIEGWSSLPHAENVLLVEQQIVQEPTLLAPNYALETLAERQWAKEQAVNLSEVEHDALVERFPDTLE